MGCALDVLEPISSCFLGTEKEPVICTCVGNVLTGVTSGDWLVQGVDGVDGSRLQHLCKALILLFLDMNPAKAES